MFLGIDIGSLTTKIAVLDFAAGAGRVAGTLYMRTQGRPIEAVQAALRQIRERCPGIKVEGVGCTGSGRYLAGMIVGADSVKNEITAHAAAAVHFMPDVQTVLEIGGQDSKIILIRNGLVADFAMNTVCAAGTGSFLDQQASRLNIPIEKFGDIALQSAAPVRIAGRCAVFAETDMIHKQQAGHSIPDILNGLCQALVRNYLNNVGKGKEILGPVLFQGGVAANKGMQRAFAEALGCPVVVPPHYGVMGAIGAAILAQEEAGKRRCTAFRGFDAVFLPHASGSFACSGCANRCEVVEIKVSGRILARWGDRCGKWSSSLITA